MADKASDNTKVILMDVVRIELKAFDPTLARMKADLAKLAGSDAVGSAAAIAEKASKVAAASKIKADADSLLAGDATSATGSRNKAGNVVKKVREFTGRNMLAEMAAAWDAANSPPPVKAKATK